MKKDILSVVTNYLDNQKSNMFRYHIAKNEYESFNEDKYKKLVLDLDNEEFTKKEDKIYILGMIHALELIKEHIENN